MSAYVWGVGTSAFGRQTERLPAELAWEALAEALADAGIDHVDAAYVGTVFGSLGVAQRALLGVGLTGIPIVTVENACASGSTALHEAKEAIVSGRYERVAVLGVEHLTSLFEGPIASDPTDREQATGLLFPGIYAMSASRYLHEHDATPEDLAAVAVKNSRHGALNPRAQRRRPLSTEDVLSSRMIAEPLTLFQCAALSDAAAAAILGPSRRSPRDVELRASALGSGGAWDHASEHVWGYDVVRDTAGVAYEEAAIGPRDADLAEVHDAFTIGELVTTEALGLAEEGGAPARVRAGDFALGGAQPVNPSGGLLSRGHPLGATGVAQVAELVWQLRGEAGDRQVQGARVGLLETMGGGTAGIDGNACVVAVFEGGA
ncbi:MAG: thiolase family protein [Solirubrobacteraceae bacterium]